MAVSGGRSGCVVGRALAWSAVLVVAAGLAGCGGGTTSASGASSGAPSTSQEPLPTDTPTPDPSGTGPADEVTTPTAAVKDCWRRGDGRVEFVKAACTSGHTAEVYAVRNLAFADYAAAKHPAKETPDVWVNRMGQVLCPKKYTPKLLAKGVKDADVAFSYVVPKGLGPTADGDGWDDHPQIVCLVELDHDRMTPRRLLA